MRDQHFERGVWPRGWLPTNFTKGWRTYAFSTFSIFSPKIIQIRLIATCCVPNIAPARILTQILLPTRPQARSLRNLLSKPQKTTRNGSDNIMRRSPRGGIGLSISPNHEQLWYPAFLPIQPFLWASSKPDHCSFHRQSDRSFCCLSKRKANDRRPQFDRGHPPRWEIPHVFKEKK